mmetsp:Transcript_33864/g.76102  ORF Transcript_33864/g.76102 Transcript_33864/m.76102 type:complete len:229 (+) Transcript_33864:251-937(+)
MLRTVRSLELSLLICIDWWWYALLGRDAAPVMSFQLAFLQVPSSLPSRLESKARQDHQRRILLSARALRLDRKRRVLHAFAPLSDGDIKRCNLRFLPLLPFLPSVRLKCPAVLGWFDLKLLQVCLQSYKDDSQVPPCACWDTKSSQSLQEVLELERMLLRSRHLHKLDLPRLCVYNHGIEASLKYPLRPEARPPLRETVQQWAPWIERVNEADLPTLEGLLSFTAQGQ